MTDLAALTYADRRAFVNGLAAIRHRPWRALLWTLWIATIAVFAWLRTRHPAPPVHGFSLGELAAQDFWICGIALVFGVILAAGSPRMTGFFSSRAEALMLVRAPTPAALVTVYLQVRTLGLTLVQSFARFSYLILIGMPVHAGPLGLAREVLLLGAAMVAVASVPLPRALARGPWRIACIAAGSAIVLLGALPLVRDGLLLLVHTPSAVTLAQRLPAWHPGVLLAAVARGDLVPVGLMFVLALAAGTIFTFVARDAYPELYALSIARIELRARMSARRARVELRLPGTLKRTPSMAVRPALRGAFALVWLETLTWTRRDSPVLSALIAAGAIALGAALALFARQNNTLGATITFFIVLANLTVAFASAAGVRLAPDLRRPLFWLGKASLYARLAAWAYASLWRDTIVVLLAVAGYIAVAGGWQVPAALAAGTLALLILTRAVGLAIFALLPNALDQRGPAVGLRLMVAYALVLPAAAPAVVAGAVTASAPATALVGLLAAICEAALLVGFSAWRLAGRVDRLAVA